MFASPSSLSDLTIRREEKSSLRAISPDFEANGCSI